VRLFEIKTPGGQIIRLSLGSVAEATARLDPGYVLTGEVFEYLEDRSGGIVVPVQPDPLPGAPVP